MAKKDTQKTMSLKLCGREKALDDIVTEKNRGKEKAKRISRHKLVIGYIDKGIQKDSK